MYLDAVSFPQAVQAALVLVTDQEEAWAGGAAFEAGSPGQSSVPACGYRGGGGVVKENKTPQLYLN